MADYTAGTASLKVRPDSRDFIRDLRADMERYKDPGFQVRIEADTRRVGAQIYRLRAEQERDQLELDLDVDTAGAKADVAKFREEQQGRAVHVDVDADTNAATVHVDEFRETQGAKPIVVRVEVDRSIEATD